MFFVNSSTNPFIGNLACISHSPEHEYPDVGFPISAVVAHKQLVSCRWATKKAGGSSNNGRKAQHKRLGVKKFGQFPLKCMEK
jgi:hypothetical protein